MKFDNADSLVEYCTKINHFAGQIWVKDSPYGGGERTLLWFYIQDSVQNPSDSLPLGISTFVYGNKYYAHNVGWDEYKGTFELVLPFTQHTKPEVYQVGDTVEVLENVRECGDYEKLGEEEKLIVGKKVTIAHVVDNFYGLSYQIINGCYLPHYCVRRVEPPKKTKISKQEIADKFGVDVTNIEIVE